MTDVDLALAAALETQVPLRLDRQPAWDDVLARAGVEPVRQRSWLGRHRSSRRRRFVLAIALLVLGITVVGSALAALGLAPFGSLGAWVKGQPGAPAPAAQQAGFAERNDSTYASFPAHTKLRLLEQETVGGKSFSLLGFRNGHSLCLRLVPSTTPAVQGINQCVTLRELRRSSAPALVVSTATFHPKGREVTGIFGFADDTVRAVRITYSAGEHEIVPVRSNVFLALRGMAAGASYGPIVQIRALTRSGKAVTVPFTLQGVVPLPSTPSYLRRTRVVLPGPTKVEATLSSATIAWVNRRESRGESFEPNLSSFDPTTRAVWARRVQPDPDDPYRVEVWVLAVGTVGRTTLQPGPVWGTSFRLQKGKEILCHAGLPPLRPAPAVYLCSATVNSAALFPPGHVVTIDRTYREAFTRVAGLAADGVREIDLSLASGRVIPAALHDNAYVVQAPSDQWPAKLVAYDAAHRAVEVETIDYASPVRSVLTACPATVPENAPPHPPSRYERVYLGTGAVAGHTLLGRSMAEVEQALGPPAATRAGELRYGTTAAGKASLTVGFDRARAVWLEFRDPNVVDARLGHVLRLQPAELERRVVNAYPGYQRAFRYGSEPALLGCSGVVRTRDRAVELSFGLDPSNPSPPFLRLSSPATSARR